MSDRAMIELLYYRQDDGVIGQDGVPCDDISAVEPVARAISEARFQLRYALREVGLHLARTAPELDPGVYSADLRWEVLGSGLQLPVIAARLPDGARSERLFPLASLRGEAVLSRLRRGGGHPELAPDRGKLFFMARPGADPGPAAAPAAGGFQVEVLDPEPDLAVRVEGLPVAPRSLSLEDSALLVEGQPAGRAIPVLCDPELLLGLARVEGQQDQEQFVERGYYLAGRCFRDGPGGDLALTVEAALPAQHTEATALSLVFTPQSQHAATEQLVQLNEAAAADPRGPLRITGWLHTHHVGAIQQTATADRAEEPNDSDASGPDAVAALEDSPVADGRFFSAPDCQLHRRGFSPASVALVLDAAAAQQDPTDLRRCYAAFGTLDGLVVRRQVHLIQPHASALGAPGHSPEAVAQGGTK